MNKKELKINDVLYCHYEIDNNFLFLKIRNNLPNGSIQETEEFCYNVISAIENVSLTGMSYYNIK